MWTPTLHGLFKGAFWGGGIIGVCVVIYQFAAYLGADKNGVWERTMECATVTGAMLVFVGAIGDSWLGSRKGAVEPAGRAD